MYRLYCLINGFILVLYKIYSCWFHFLCRLNICCGKGRMFRCQFSISFQCRFFGIKGGLRTFLQMYPHKHNFHLLKFCGNFHQYPHLHTYRKYFRPNKYHILIYNQCMFRSGDINHVDSRYNHLDRRIHTICNLSDIFHIGFENF